jgi:hypothetical protein
VKRGDENRFPANLGIVARMEGKEVVEVKRSGFLIVSFFNSLVM